ncbi:2-acylglycerol O-acyltransferase 2-A-like isoform X2 [Haliaeetus albicilla]|uniref:2-acylglycerol O-acyltransferase 2-A-like isoform X2 n=1 Tax=Haliaeetus albicilla TaxID=8969 RepID=UPI0037E96A99
MPLHFAPLRLPLRRRLQTAAVLQWVCSFLALGQLCALLFALALRGSLWLPALLYGLWLLADRDTPRRGGRRSAWVRGWPLWTYFRDYFPISLVRTTELDPRHNYIFGFHPHGVLAAGAFANFCTEATGFGVLFPGLRPHLLTLPCWFRLPLFRDYMMSGGLVSSEKSSLEYLLSREGGGQVAVIALGGPPESLDAHPGALTLQLLGRKGFVRIALEHGASLVPVFSFGENELFRQIPNPPGSGLRRFQLRLQRILGVAIPLFHARGVFQYSFGLLPFRRPIHTVVGSPLVLPRTPNPSPQTVERWHGLYLERLVALFEEHKLGAGSGSWPCSMGGGGSGTGTAPREVPVTVIGSETGRFGTISVTISPSRAVPGEPALPGPGAGAAGSGPGDHGGGRG